MTRDPRRPAAFRLDDADVAVVPDGAAAPSGASVVVETMAPDDEQAVVPAPRRGLRFGRMVAGALGGLLALAAGLWVDGLVRALFARQDLLGWLALALVALLVVGVVAILLREALSLWRLARIDRLRASAEAAAATDSHTAAATVVRDLVALYRERPETARGRRAMAGHLAEVMDGRDLLVLAEAELLGPLDAAATRLVSDAARRVSLVTAVSPRAVVDLVMVAVTVATLIRRLGQLYGGRPGFLGFLSLSRQVLGHLALTGGMAAGDSLIQQLVGHGVAARLSARLGEGVVNGLLTARVGLSAIDVCRPLPFLALRRPGVQEVMGSVIGRGAGGEPPAS